MQTEKLKNLRVLYVEDELDLQEVVASILIELVGTIDYFSNGIDALNSFKNNQYDLIITDINMPKLNGIELIKKVRLENKDIPIIVTSSYSDNDYLKDVKDVGMSSYLIKPLNFEYLIKDINILIK